MYDFTDSPLVRNDKTLVLAYDHGPKQFAGVEERLDPREVFEMATHDAGTVSIHGRGADTPERTDGRVGLTGERPGAAMGRLTRTKRVRTR